MPAKLNNWSAPPPGRMLVGALVLLFLGLAMAVQAEAAAPTPYGEYFVRVGAQWPDAGIVAGNGKPVSEVQPRDRLAYERQVRLLEEEGGPYAGALAEPLADLARQYQVNGDYAEAQEIYERAIHVLRINEGLYSESQVPLLNALFDIYRLSGDVSTLDGRYDYYFRLYGNGEPPFTTLRIGASLAYLRWQREALRLQLDSRDTERLLALYSLNERILAGVAAVQPLDLPSFTDLTLGQLRNLYILRDRYAPIVETTGVGSREAFGGGTWDQQDAALARLEIIQRSAVPRGQALLRELIERIPVDQWQLLAQAYLELADWNQWNDRRTEAQSAYRQVASILQAAGQEATLQQWLGQVVELPANGAFWQPRPAGAEPIVIQARYDVSESGRAANIVTSALIGENEAKAWRVRRGLA